MRRHEEFACSCVAESGEGGIVVFFNVIALEYCRSHPREAKGVYGDHEEDPRPAPWCPCFERGGGFVASHNSIFAIAPNNVLDYSQIFLSVFFPGLKVLRCTYLVSCNLYNFKNVS